MSDGPRKPSQDIAAFVLRSGHAVPYDPADGADAVEQLRHAITDDVIAGITEEMTWDEVADEVVKEITHVTTTATPGAARLLLHALLTHAVFELLISIQRDLDSKAHEKHIDVAGLFPHIALPGYWVHSYSIHVTQGSL